LILVVIAYAAPVSVTTRLFSAESGTHFNVTGKLIATDKGLSKTASTITATGNCPSSNVTFISSAQSANDQIIAGDLVYDIQVNTTLTTPTLACLTVNLVVIQSGGSQQTYTLTLATGSSIADGWTINCKFDIGAFLPASTYSFKTTVGQL